MKQTDRRRVFKKNREVLNGDEVFKEDGDYFYGNWQYEADKAIYSFTGFLLGGTGGNRTRVRHPFSCSIYERSRIFNLTV